MKGTINNTGVFDRSLVYLFPVIMSISLIQALGLSSAYTPWVFALYYIAIGFWSFGRIHKAKYFRGLFLVWFIYILVSCLTAGLPLSFVTEEFKRFIAPSLFVFVGMSCKEDKIYKSFLYATVVSIVVGFILLALRPSWYVAFLVNVFNNQWYSSSAESASSIMETAFRFQSFFSDCYAISYFGSFSMCIILCDIYKKNRIINKTWLQVIMMGVLFIAIIMSGFRVAIVYVLLSFMWMMIYGTYTKNHKKKVFIGALVAIVVLVLILLLTDNEYVVYLRERLVERFSDLSYESAMEGSRNTQQEKVLESWENVIFGDGTGSHGAQARIEGLPAITDGGYVKMLVENGLVGISLFALIMLSTLKMGIRHMKYYMVELLIIGYVLLSLLGANSLAMDWSYSLLFWFSVGRIWNKKVLEQRVLNSEGI